MFGLSNKALDLITEAIKRHPEIEEALIYGSRAMGNNKHSSDIDIAIKGKHVTFDTVSKLHTYLEQEVQLPHYFDVTDYNNLKEDKLKEHIDNEGKIFYRS